MSSLAVRHISRCTIKPKCISEDAPKRCELTPWDLAMLSAHYIQTGLLFCNPSPTPEQEEHENPIVHSLKDSLSQVLVHFFPLAGRLATEHDSSSSSSSSHVFVDCNGMGAEFIHAVADITIADILTPLDVPYIVKSFFTFDGAVNHDGHSIPLLAVQLTQLLDGFFIGFSFNHAIGDGASFWNFFNAWSEITRGGEASNHISHPPITQRWFCDLDPSHIRLPFSNASEFIERFTPPCLRERIFHFTHQSIAVLKAKANKACKSNSNNINSKKKISSFQALCTLVWRSITRARQLPTHKKTSCRLAIDNRSRLQPPLSPHYFGNCLQVIAATTTVGELLSHDLCWGAWLIHECIAAHTDATVRGTLDAWVKAPFVYHLSGFDGCSVMMGCSPRFGMYGNDFGWGKPMAVRGGYASKYDGKLSSYPGREGGGSVDLEICLFPEFMDALELDMEFMELVSPLEVL